MTAVGGYANMPSGHFESARWHHFRTEHVSTLVCQHAQALRPSLVSISARLLRRLVSTLQPPASACQHFSLSYGLRMITPAAYIVRTCASFAPTISIRHSRHLSSLPRKRESSAAGATRLQPQAI